MLILCNYTLYLSSVCTYKPYIMAEKTKKTSTRKNPLIKEVHGVPIRNSNKIALRYNARDYEKLLNGAFNAGVSLAGYINLHLRPCASCGSQEIIVPRAHIPLKKQSDGKTSIFERNK